MQSRLIQSPSTQAESEHDLSEATQVGKYNATDLDENGDSIMEGVTVLDGDNDDKCKTDKDDGGEDEEALDLDFDTLWMNTHQLINHVSELGPSGLVDEYLAVCSINTNDPCTAFRLVFYRLCSSTCI